MTFGTRAVEGLLGRTNTRPFRELYTVAITPEGESLQDASHENAEEKPKEGTHLVEAPEGATL